jgi:hypothetical protein
VLKKRGMTFPKTAPPLRQQIPHLPSSSWSPTFGAVQYHGALEMATNVLVETLPYLHQ